MKKGLYYIISILFIFSLTTACKDNNSKSYTPPPVSGVKLQPQFSVDDTVKQLRQIVKEDPKNLDAWIRLGNTLMDTNRFEEAIEAYSKALELDPKNTNVRVDMGTCYRRIGKPDIAVKEYNRAIEIDPKHLFAHRNKGIVLAFDLKKPKEAIKEFETYLSLAPDAADAQKIKQIISELKEHL
ncbi:MAG: tetratricopeptide repeat protein [Nitrospirae bacterium]|nr:MAG: tetratricopeptide repeat protein [Nitrospirota bacterium]